jgi:hypothetical protein
MTRNLIAVLLVLGLAACQRNASDQPESTTDAAPSNATPSETTATTTPPTANASSDATTAGSPTPADSTTPSDAAGSTMGAQTPPTDSTATTGAMATEAPPTDTTADAAGGSTLGGTKTDATLDADLRRCDTMTGTERTTCRSEAQTRYDQRTMQSDGSVKP